MYKPVSMVIGYRLSGQLEPSSIMVSLPLIHSLHFLLILFKFTETNCIAFLKEGIGQLIIYPGSSRAYILSRFWIGL